MFTKSTWLHLRIPFSFFLLPVFLFALAISPNIGGLRLLVVFLSLHLFLYPASNGYNSYFDKDKKSIGGLKNPPPVRKGLYSLSLLFDLIALVLGAFVSWVFVGMLLVYGLISKAYSHPSIRLKKYPWASWLIIGLFQGCFTLMMAYIGINGFGLDQLMKPQVYLPGFLSSLLLWGSYPTTQIYQHEEDRERGDRTLSRVLGIRGTLHFTAGFFVLAFMGFTGYFKYFFTLDDALHFTLYLFPVLLFFGYWYIKVRKDEKAADYVHTMWLSGISALCLNAFFIAFFLKKSQLLQLFH